MIFLFFISLSWYNLHVQIFSARTNFNGFLINPGMNSKDEAAAAEFWIEHLGILDTVLST
jgi:hypothetical protein